MHQTNIKCLNMCFIAENLIVLDKQIKNQHKIQQKEGKKEEYLKKNKISD